MPNSPLSAAYYGYNHQDMVTAYALASLLLPRSENQTITVERKAVENDRFDDLELIGNLRTRVQIKAHQGAMRSLRLSDFTRNTISFRIDQAVRSVIEDDNPADRYRLFTTYTQLSDDLLPYIVEDQSSPPLLPGLRTRRFRLDIARIWPEGEQPLWPHIEDLGRVNLALFCARFLVELECPQLSGDLREPGALEKVLLGLLGDRVGVGIWPNHNRDLANATAHLIYAAQVARVESASLVQEQVINTLALRVDYGRVDEMFHVDERRLVPQQDALDCIVDLLTTNQRLAVTGSPGIGKSWLLHQLATRLRDEGWVVGLHYCFIDPYESERVRRASIDTTFGSIMAELIDADPSLMTEGMPRFAAGPRELQQLLDNAASEIPHRRIVIIVDGLDHIDRLPDRLNASTAAALVEELAAIGLPLGTALVLGSQPGEHLNSFLEGGGYYYLRRWPDEDMRALAERMGVVEALRDGDLVGETERTLSTIVTNADGNPLYATYLSRTAIELTHEKAPIPPEGDIPGYLAGMPVFDDDLNAYYRWLLDEIAQDAGRLWIAELLGMIGFPVSEEELGSIVPEFRHHVPTVLSYLAPVLDFDDRRGGIRIYHESFQRHVRNLVGEDANADVAAILAPAIDWLKDRGFFTDTRSFRYLLELLQRAGRDNEVVALFKEDFVAKAATHCQPADAVQANIAVAAVSAAELLEFPALARLVELSRAADYLYQNRLDDHTLAEIYGRTYAELFGASSLTDRLLHDGRCTFPARPGLILCQMCDEQGVAPPWMEYRAAHDLQIQTDNTSYGPDSDRAINAARLVGRMRLNGRRRSIQDCVDWLKTPDQSSLHSADLAITLGEIYGTASILEAIDSLPSGRGLAWAHFALMVLAVDHEEARSQAEIAISEGLPRNGWRECLQAGANPHLFEREPSQLKQLTERILMDGVRFEEDVVADWLTEIELAASVGDNAALLRGEASIPADSWFHRWLRFCVIMAHPSTTSDQVVVSLQELSHEINVFEGAPRVVDLYGLHHEIRRSFRRVLEGLDGEEWQSALDSLKKISHETSTWLQRSRSGPLPADAFLELVMAVADTDAKRLSASALGEVVLSPELQGGEIYDTHARDSLLLARVHFLAGKRDLAEDCWFKAATYLAAYGWRKDITVFELLDPIKVLANGDPVRSQHCLHDIQHVVEGIRVHTDGSETNYAIHQWLDLAAEIHPAGALAYLARSSISRVPDFGGFDHALPRALVAVDDQLEPMVNVAGWIGAGYEVRTEPEAAILAGEIAAEIDSLGGRAIWSTMVASLDGDGGQATSELKELVEESACRLALSPPLIEVDTHTNNQNQRLDSPVRKSNILGITHTSPFLLPVSASPLQIVHTVRKWYDWQGEKPKFDGAANAIGWRLLELLESGEGFAAEVVIQKIARDTPRWDSNEFLVPVGDGFVIRGESRCAALAYAYSYTRSRDGWRRFAGQKAEQWFLKAIELDGEVGWSILADEVADSIAYGGEYGVTAHMIELLASAGRLDDAFSSWDAAYRVVGFRVPSTGLRDKIDIPYNHEADDPSASLAEALVARMNHYILHERRMATAGVALLVNHSPRSLAAGVRLATLKNAPASTLITLLNVIKDFEPDPYEATQAAAPELSLIARGELVSARVLARRLLERIGLSVPYPPPLDDSVISLLPEERVSELVEGIGSGRIEPVVEIWPEFGERVAGKLDQLFRSEDLKSSMQRALRQLDPAGKGRHLPVWLPVDEEIERTLQTTGCAVRTALAKKGMLDTKAEDEVAFRLLGDLEIGVRHALSRIVRPSYIPAPSSLTPGYCLSDLITIPCGNYTGWVVAGHRETELLLGDGHDKPVKARIQVSSGIIFTDDWSDDNGLPFGYGHSVVWRIKPPQTTATRPFQGPLIGLEILRDTFGSLEVLAPHPDVSVASRLMPARFGSGLTLVDGDGEPAVVCRIWRRKLIGNEYPHDRVHRFEGMLLIVHPDVIESTLSRATKPATYVRVVSHKNEGLSE